jgi:hypothetical protein
MPSSRTRLVALLAAGLFAAAAPARADIWDNVLFGLTEAGFQFNGARNFLSGGADLVVSRNFTGQTLDFGATQLTITGTPVFRFSTGGRGLQTLDISLDTNNTPLTYTLITDSGSQTTTINGSFLLDAATTINSFGWYDLTLDASSRQDITQDGRFNNDTTQNDFDIGPIHVRGNLFADLAASITDPLFKALGVDNIFASFSGAAQFQDQATTLAKALESKSTAGEMLTADEVAQLISMTTAADAFGFDTPDLGFLDGAAIEQDPDAESSDLVSNPVPEPSSLALIVLAGVAVLRRQPRAR